MSITIQCQCSRVITVSSELAGQTTRCPSCGRRQRIPDALPVEAAPVADAVAYDGQCPDCDAPILVGAAYCHACGLPRDPVDPAAIAVEPMSPPTAGMADDEAVSPARRLVNPAAAASARSDAPPVVVVAPVIAPAEQARQGRHESQHIAAELHGHGSRCGHRRARDVARQARTYGCCASFTRKPRETATSEGASARGPFREARAEQAGGGAPRANGWGRVGLSFSIMSLIAAVFMAVFATAAQRGGWHCGDSESGAIRSSGAERSASQSEPISDLRSVEPREYVRISTDDDSITVTCSTSAPAVRTPSQVRSCDPHKSGQRVGPVKTGSRENSAIATRRAAIGKLSAGMGVLSIIFAGLGALCGFCGLLAWRRPKGQAVWALILATGVVMMAGPHAKAQVHEIKCLIGPHGNCLLSVGGDCGYERTPQRTRIFFSGGGSQQDDVDESYLDRFRANDGAGWNVEDCGAYPDAAASDVGGGCPHPDFGCDWPCPFVAGVQEPTVNDATPVEADGRSRVDSDDAYNSLLTLDDNGAESE